MSIDTSKIVTADQKVAEELEANNAAIQLELQTIDLASIRALREWVASQPGAPQFIIDHEAAAQAKRGQLK